MEPPLATRLEYGLGMIAATLANVHRDAKKRREPFTAKDFIPRWGGAGDKPKALDPKAVQAKMRGVFAGRIVKKNS